MNRIKKARIAAGLSQKQVALALQVAGPSVCGWESGKTSPTPDNFCKLADLFGVSIDYLMGRINDDKAEKEVKTKQVCCDKGNWCSIHNDLMAAVDQLTWDEEKCVLAFIAGMKAMKGR